MMRKLLNFKTYMLIFSALILLGSCSEEASPLIADLPEKNIVETAQQTDALGNLVAALTKADENEDSNLIGALSGDGPFTVFAPTNEAFAALLEQLDGYDSLDDFNDEADKAVLATILKYHVVAGLAARSTDLADEQSITTLQGEALKIDLEGGVFIQDATESKAAVVLADVEASNGIVHVIDKVLLPQEILDLLNGENEEEEEEEELGTLVDIVVAAESLSILEAAVIKAGLVETLNSEGPFTVFAPGDDAFLALLDILGDDYNNLDDFDTEAEMMLLKDILLYHVIPARVLAEDLEAGMVGTALENNMLEVIASGDSFTIGDASEVDAQITGTDILASNGVAHTINKVLLPQSAIDFVTSLKLKTIVEIAVETNDLSLLVEALQQANAGLVETLGSEGPFTVFAPTNEAFAALLEALGNDYQSLSDFDTEEELALLVKVLTYHVVAGTEAFSADLSDGQMIETFQGENVNIAIKDGAVHIVDATGAGATVVIADVKASNGVVHVIDKVLLPQEVLDLLNPPTPNIVELAQSVDDLSLLVAALIQADAGLVEVLSGDGPYTVFAPTNAAFAALLDALGADYNGLDDFDTADEKALLASILTYHVVPGAAVASTDLVDHQELMTVQGESLFALVDHGVAIRDKSGTDANVSSADNLASNGIVHLIDKVLLPQAAIDALNPPTH